MNMKKKRAQPADAAELRHRAEAKLSEHKKKAAPSPAAEADSLRLVHELQVHQIELEMQNEELMRARAELEEAYRQFSNLYDFAPVGYFTLARNGTIHDANLAGANLLQVERSKLIKRRFGLFVSVESRPAFSVFFEKLLSGDGKKTCELALLKNGEARFWARLEATCFEGGQECRAVLVDITARRQAEEKLRESEKRFRALIEYSYDGLTLLDTQGQIIYYSPSIERITGYTSDERVEQSGLALVHPDDREQGTRDLREIVLNPGAVNSGVYRIRHKNGSWRWVESVTRNLLTEPGVQAIVMNTRDITDRKQAEELLLAAHSQLQAHLAEIEKLQIELREQAIRDPLTGLYNRRYLFESLSREVPRAIREGYPISIILLDIDHFKIINDTFGHDAGDKALRVLATQLKTLSRAEDIICRYGGDEHLIVMHNTTADKALERADQLRKAIARKRLSHTGKAFKFTGSFGVAVFPVDGATIEEVISAADHALYQSKKTGRNRVTLP